MWTRSDDVPREMMSGGLGLEKVGYVWGVKAERTGVDESGKGLSEVTFVFEGAKAELGH